MIESRFSRQEALFGREGQELIQKCKVAIVGLGGTGSHVNQQLAYLGVQSFILIDGENAEITNLNRLVGMTPDDVGVPKVEIAARLIHQISPSASVTLINKSVRDREALNAIKTLADCIFGCIDTDGIRFILNELSCAFDRPFIDIATDTELGIGGRMVFSFDGNSCLYCLEELSKKDIHAELATEKEREEYERIYGIKLQALGSTGPSVVSLNGIISSLAVTEFFNFITKLRSPSRYLCYRGDSGIITKRNDAPGQTCPYCGIRGKGKTIDIERYAI